MSPRHWCAPRSEQYGDAAPKNHLKTVSDSSVSSGDSQQPFTKIRSDRSRVSRPRRCERQADQITCSLVYNRRMTEWICSSFMGGVGDVGVNPALPLEAGGYLIPAGELPLCTNRHQPTLFVSYLWIPQVFPNIHLDKLFRKNHHKSGVCTLINLLLHFLWAAPSFFIRITTVLVSGTEDLHFQLFTLFSDFWSDDRNDVGAHQTSDWVRATIKHHTWEEKKNIFTDLGEK